jgi:hypothetical protein
MCKTIVAPLHARGSTSPCWHDLVKAAGVSSRDLDTCRWSTVDAAIFQFLLPSIVLHHVTKHLMFLASANMDSVHSMLPTRS